MMSARRLGFDLHCGLLVLALALLILPGFARGEQLSAIDLSGQWCATSYQNTGTATNRTERSEILIEMKGKAVNVRSTSGSVWSGTYEAEQRLLSAKYQRNEIVGRVILWLDKSERRLAGDWFNLRGDAGTYEAYRKSGDTCEVELTS